MVHRSLTNLIGNGMEGSKHVQRGLWGMYISFLHCRCCSSATIQEPNFEHAMAELRTLLECFANYKSLDIVIDAINALIDDTRRDQSLRESGLRPSMLICTKYFLRFCYFVYALIPRLKQVLLQPGYVLEPACNDQGNCLRETGRHFYDDKYCDHFDNLFNSVSDWFNAMTEDLV